jgi:perosamine synthetase
MTDKKIIQIALPYIGEEEIEALKIPLQSGWLTSGPQVTQFEKTFSEMHQSSYGVAVTSCTTGLHLILDSMGIGPGDEVIVPSFTWVATANAVLYCGAKPVFVDVEPLSFNIDPQEVAKKVNEKTKAIIAVHLFGLCADMDRLKAVAPNVPIIEDAACAAGARYKNKMAGSLGYAAAFSFHPRKTITTGEGGMITTNSVELYEMMGVKRNHGASVSEEQRHLGPKPFLLPSFFELGYNYRMTDLQGAMGNVQLQRLEKLVGERRKFADFYLSELATIDWIVLPKVSDDYFHSWQSFVCRVDESKSPYSRNVIMEKLLSRGIHTRPGTHAVHMLDFYKRNFGIEDDDYPVARDCDKLTMAIPLHNKMNMADYQYVIQALREIGT